MLTRRQIAAPTLAGDFYGSGKALSSEYLELQKWLHPDAGCSFCVVTPSVFIRQSLTKSLTSKGMLEAVYCRLSF